MISLISFQFSFFRKQSEYSDDVNKTNEASYQTSRENDTIDIKYGFDRVKDNNERTGYLINMHSVRI